MLLPFRKIFDRLRKGETMGIFTKEQLRELIRKRNLVTADDVQNMLKDMFGETLQEMLEAELDSELGVL